MDLVKVFTRVTLMIPVLGFFLVGSYMAIRQLDMSGYVQLATSFSAIYVPALTAYVSGTSIKRAQEKKE